MTESEYESEYDTIKSSLNKMRYLGIITEEEFDEYAEKAHYIYLSLIEATE